MRRLIVLLGFSGWCLLGPALVVGADEAVQLLGVTVGETGNQVVCHLKTKGLPAEKQLQSMRSGLISSVELDFSLLDEESRFLGGHTQSLRLAFDLWEEFFSVRDDGKEHRFNSLLDLQEYLADLENLPVAAVALLDRDKRYRLRVGLVVHAIAPEEQSRVEKVISGGLGSRDNGPDQQEASVSLGRLIRFFYKGDEGDRGSIERFSDWFIRQELELEKN